MWLRLGKTGLFGNESLEEGAGSACSLNDLECWMWNSGAEADGW